MDSKNVSFSEKYKPKTISDIIGNSKQVKEIKSWLNNFSKNRTEHFNNPKKKKKIKIIEYSEDNDDPAEDFVKITKTNDGNHSCLLLIGRHGVGKTCVVTTILKNLDYKIETINLSSIGSNKMIAENINRLTMFDNIYDKLNEKKNTKRVLLIDEIESANSPVEKSFIQLLLKRNEEHWVFPIIFISDGKHSKFNTVIKVNSNIVYFPNPGEEEMIELYKRIVKNEKMMFESEQVVKDIFKLSQNDYRRLLTILEDLNTTFHKKVIRANNIIDYEKVCKRKDIDTDIYKATAQMILNYENIDECFRLYEGDKVIVPLVIEQNYITCLSKYNSNPEKLFDFIDDIANSIAFGDMIENYIYSDQNWDMKEVHAFLSCAYPSYKLSGKKLNIGEEYLRRALKFPYDFNRTSIKKINKKNVINSNNCLTNFEIDDFMYANKLIKHLIEKNRLEECIDLFDGYGASYENLDSILKIDKITEKSTVPTAIKRRLTELLASQ